MTVERIAEAVARRLEPAVIAELEASRAAVLADVGLIERAIVSHHWPLIEREVSRLLRAVTAEGIHLLVGDRS